MDSFSEVIHYHPPTFDVEERSTNAFYPNDSNMHDRSSTNCTESFNFPTVCYDSVDEDDDVKRPMNSFLLWAKIMRRKCSEENPNLHNAEVSKLLGKIWNSMSMDEKRPFVERAEKLRLLHMRTYPNYRYAPKKKKDKKVNRMISPEVAAALHSTLFKVNNTSGQTVSPDLKSFGYLNSFYRSSTTKNFNCFTNLCEDNTSEVLHSPVSEKSCNRMRNNSNQVTMERCKNVNRKSVAHGSPKGTTDVQDAKQQISSTEESDVIYVDPTQRSQVASMTLHYYPTSQSIDVSMESDIKFCENNSTSKHTYLKNSQELLINDTNDSHINNVACNGHVVRQSCGKNNNVISDLVDSCCDDENIQLSFSPKIKPIVDDIPEILQSLINSPNLLSYDSIINSDDTSLWSDIGDVINNS